MKSGKPIPEKVDWIRLEKAPPDERQAELLLGTKAIERDKLRGLARSLTPEVVTFSRNVTIPVTRLCRNRCHYCGFRNDNNGFLRWNEILPVLSKAQKRGCCEALFMSGERPELAHEKARTFLSREGFDSTAEYVTWLCGRTLDETDLLPHTNIGVLDPEEIRALGEVNASLGLMLEDASPRLCGDGMPHSNSPGKDPLERLRTIEDAGKIRVPFTTGLLIGIGQTNAEIVRSLAILKRIQSSFGHIQEVIIQRFLPKPGTAMASRPPPPTALMMNIFSVARLMFGSSMNLQVPPNIEHNFEEFIISGANDLGGISAVTPDYINPQKLWCSEDEIFKRVSSIGFRTEPRPAVYPEYTRDEYLSAEILSRTKIWIRRMRNEEEGL